jgi:hypothetical protein
MADIFVRQEVAIASQQPVAAVSNITPAPWPAKTAISGTVMILMFTTKISTRQHISFLLKY